MCTGTFFIGIFVYWERLMELGDGLSRMGRIEDL